MSDLVSSLFGGELFFGDRHLLLYLGAGYLLWLLVLAYRRRAIARAALSGNAAGEASTSAAVRFSSLRSVHRLKPSRTLVLRRLAQGLRLLTVALLVLAMARPQTGRTQTSVRTEGIDIVLVLDTSGSMRALDLDADQPLQQRRNRLEVAVDVVDAFVKKRPNDQIGLVIFGEQAFTQCPLTLDHGIVATFLERMEIGMAGDATAIGSALGIAVKRLQDSSAKSKVIILLTDGVNNAGALPPVKAAEIAQTLGVKVYSIGVGTMGKAPFLVDSLFGTQVAYEDVQIDEAMLQQVSDMTGGLYQRAQDREALEGIYAKIDELERTEITMDSYTEYDERFRWFVLPAIVLLLLEVVLLGTRLRKLP